MSKKKHDILGTSGKDNLGLVIDFAQKLKNGSLPAIRARRFLRGEILDFPIWRTIKLGVKSANNLTAGEYLCKMLIDEGYKISDEAFMYLSDRRSSEYLAPEFIASKAGIEVDLVIVTPFELGCKKPTKVADIYKTAQDLGLQLCPLEVGPQLRLQYSSNSQPLGEVLSIATKPISYEINNAPFRNLRFFKVLHNNEGGWLGMSITTADSTWPVGVKWVFCKKK